MTDRPYELLDSVTLTEWRRFRLTREQIRLPDGAQLTRHSIRHPGAVLMLPRLADGTLLLVHQFRHAPDCHLLEFPAGTLEADETPLECAQRELAEEVGHRAGRWRSLGILYPAPGFCDERLHCFLAEDLEPVELCPEADEFIEVRRMRADDLEAVIADGSATDAKTLALYVRARAMGLF
jgi:ADP-ribose pyrophosphatase